MEKTQWFAAMIEELEAIPLIFTFLSTYGTPSVFGILIYLAQGVGLSTIARRRGLERSWLAWLPLGNLWILGSISDQYRQLTVEQVRNKKQTLLLLGLFCLAAAVAFVIGLWAAASGMMEARYPNLSPVAAGMGFFALFLLTGALWLLLRINSYIALFDLLRSCEPGKAMVYLLLCIIVYAAQPFVVFALRNKDNGIPLRRDPRMYYRENTCEF